MFFLFLFTLFTLPFIVLSHTQYRFAIILSESVNAHIALIKMGTTYHKDDYMVFCWRGIDPNQQSVLKQGMRLIKRVGCIAGENLQVSSTEVTCGDEILGLVRHKNIEGELLKAALYKGVIPEGYAFMIGDNYASYDSRYLGLIDTKDFIARVVFML